MDNKERAEPSLPLPVQDIVKHMRKSLKEEKTRYVVVGFYEFCVDCRKNH